MHTGEEEHFSPYDSFKTRLDTGGEDERLLQKDDRLMKKSTFHFVTVSKQGGLLVEKMRDCRNKVAY